MRKILLLTILIVVGFTIQAQKQLPKIKIKDLKGQELNSTDLIDSEKPVVISFWATWCKPCLNEMEAITDVFEEWKEEKDFRFVAVSTDDARSSSRVKSLIAGKGWPFEFYLDQNQDLKRALNIATVPYLIIINTKGEIVYQHSGYTPGSEEFLFEEILKH